MKRNVNTAESPQAGQKPADKATRLETTGLLIIGVLLLLYAMVRCWHNIPWSLR